MNAVPPKKVWHGENCPHLSDDNLPCTCGAIPNALNNLRTLLDVADGALDKDTYGQFKGQDRIPDDADVIIQYGTQRKINALFAALDKWLPR